MLGVYRDNGKEHGYILGLVGISGICHIVSTWGLYSLIPY